MFVADVMVFISGFYIADETFVSVAAVGDNIGTGKVGFELWEPALGKVGGDFENMCGVGEEGFVMGDEE